MRVDANRLSSSFSSILSALHQATALRRPAPSGARAFFSLLLVWMLVLQTTVPMQVREAQTKARNKPASSGQRLQDNEGDWLTRLALLTSGRATSALSSESALSPSLDPVLAPVAATGIAVVRHAPSINGNSRVEGSLRQLTGESVTLNGGAVITENLQVPGTPTLLLNGHPTFGGTIQGTGSAQPANYQVTLNGGTTVLGHLVTRTDPILLPGVTAPPASQGTRSVTITAAGQSAGNFATLRDLTLNGNAGMFTVPPGTYRNFIANGGSGFVFGISGASQPSTYNLSTLTLNGQGRIQIVGPVKLTLACGLTLNASMGSASNPAWLNLQVSSGGVILNGGSSLYAVVKAPAGTVIINGNAQLIGAVACDRLTVNGGGLLRLTESALPPVNQPPVVSAGANQTITLPGAAALNGSVTDDGLPQGSSITTGWSKVSGPGNVNFANANNTVTTAAFSQSGTYVLRLTASDSQLTNSSDVMITVIAENHAPTVNAGPDQTINLPSSAALNGSVSDDGLPVGRTLTTQWSQVSGPAAVVFANANVTVTTASFSLAGTYVLRLTASDSELNAADDLTITVIDSRVPPIADFVAPQSSGAAGAFVIAPPGSAAVAQLLDSDITTFWSTPNISNQSATLQFFDQEMVFIDRVRLQAANGVVSNASLKDFDVQVSPTTSDDANFVTVFSGTLLNTGELQEFVFPVGPARARYIKLLLKNNYGSPGNIQLATFNPVAVGSADNIISLPGQTDASLSQSPGLIANGAAIYDSSYPGGAASPNGLLGYNNGGWFPSVTTNPFAIIQLAGGKLFTLSGIKLATAWNLGFGSATAVRDFEVWVSAATPEDASFTKVLTATATFSGHLQTFTFPGGTVAARYVKYVPISNGGGPTINTQSFDVIAEGVAQVLSSSGQNQDILNPAEAAFDGDVQSIWFSPGNVTTNVWVKTALADEATHKVYGVRINPVNDFSNGQRGPKDFDIRVSTTTADDSAFTTVFSGTLANTFNGGTQEFLFPDFVEARYVQFFWKNGYSTANIGVRALEVLAAPTRGAALVSFSSQEDPASNALDMEPSNQWVPALNNPTNQWLKLLLPNADLATINHIALRPAIAASGSFSAPKDFELQVSAADSADSSFTTVLAGTLADSTQLQDFYFSPLQARCVRLLVKNSYGSGRFGLASFYVYSADQIGSTTHFLDRSTDADGAVVAWSWDFGDGATSSERNPTHTFAAPGDYNVSLTVTDNNGLTNTHQVPYHVLDSVLPDFGYSPIISHEGGESVRFTDITRLLTQATTMRRYDFGDGTTLFEATTSSLHTFDDSGVFHATLNVGDPLGISLVTSKDIVVLNVAPAVDIDPGMAVVWGEQWTSVPRISDQSSVDSASLQGQWDFGDGQASPCVNCTNANATVTHAYGNPGTYTVVLTITDKDGGVGSDNAVFTVNKRPTSISLLTTESQGNGETFLVRAKLTETFANIGMPGKPIQFALNGVAASATTDLNGIAEVSFSFAAGAHVGLGTATFVEDNLYQGCGAVFGDPLPATNFPGTAATNKGRDFWIVVLDNYLAAFGSITVDLYITAEVATNGTVTAPNFGPVPFTVSAHGVTRVPIGLENYLHNSDVVETKGIHVTSQQPVAVFELNNLSFTTDAFLGLPTEALGTDYVVLGYKNGGSLPGSHFGIVAPFNGTNVTITPSATTGTRIAGVPYTVTLDQGQTYYLKNVVASSEVDLSGTLIASDRPIGVFGGHLAANVPDGSFFANHLVEQLTPTNTWGRHFVTLPYASRGNGDTFRFIAAEEGTSIYLNGQRIAVLNRGQLHERILTGPSFIVSDKPILVAQYSNGARHDGGTGDPSMALVPPYEQFLNSYAVSSPEFGTVHFINVMAPAAAVGSVILDGAAIPPSSFVPISNSGFFGAQLAVARGAHNLSGPSAFGVSVYGFSFDDAYAYPGGIGLQPSVSSSNMILAPGNSTAVIGVEDCVTATLLTPDGNPLGAQTISFTVTGVNTANGSVATNAAGQAQFCYTGASIGNDLILATAGSSSATATKTWQSNIPNQPPVVNAGADQTITQPAPASLQGSASDDGLPTNTLTVLWSKVGGPGNVTFGDPNAAATTAAFAAPGIYVLRLTASDTVLSSSDELQVTVNEPPINQPPTANAGPDQTVALTANLITNGGNEDLLVNGEIPGWTEVQGTTWTEGSANSGSGFPEAQRGSAYFLSGNAAQAELRQDVDLSAYAANIAAGTQQFEFKAYLRSLAEPLPDAGRVVLEYRDVTNTTVIAALDSGDITSTVAWHLTDDTRIAPLGTGWIRVRLIAARNSNAAGDASNDAFFDSVSLRPVGAAAVKLNGIITDDGLPYGSSLTASWNMVSGPGAVMFATANAAVTGASFTRAGTYVLRLTSSDGQANTSDDVTVIVNPPNQAPVVNAGASQTITLPATADLEGTVTDDGQPAGSSVSISWSKVSGPGVVTFANSNQATTTASFSAAGTYVLRLAADDTEYDAGANVTITVNPEPTQVNQPPAVNPGANHTISLPVDTVTLNGTATDDGLPAGSTLTVTWTQVSGPGEVTFGNANSAVTTAQFSAAGSYVLRLSASDGAYVASADVGVILTPQNQAPTANAGADQTILLSQVAQLDGGAGDDGLPAGSSLTTTWTAVSGPGTATFGNPTVTVTAAQLSTVGVYVLRLTASDGELSASDDVTVTVNDDVAPPTVAITAPVDGSSVTEPAIVVGSVSDGAWQLEHSLASDDNTNNRIWTTFASGNGPVSNVSLGTLDPTMMLNGLFTIRLSATDTYGQISRTSISVIVERNLKVGNFTVSFSDLNIPVAGVPMEVTRTYDSRDKRVGDFGFGWTLGLRNIRLEKSGVLGFKWFETVSEEVSPNYCLEAIGSHVVTVTFPRGKVFKFQAAVTPQCQRLTPITTGTVSFTPLPGTHGTLEVIGSADFQVEGSIPGPVNLIGFGGGVDIFNSFAFKFTAEDGTAYLIDQRTGLQSVADTNNNTVTVSAGGIIHSSGGIQTNGISFTRDSLGRITSVIDPAGNAQTYTYDNHGDLVSYADNENNTSTYNYNTTHRLLTIHDPRGLQPIRNDYDADGRLISHTDGFGKVITYLHDLPARVETITDRLGHPTSFEYDERGNVLRKTDARAGVTTFTYDANDNLLTETNALGKATTFTYDANDHRTSITDPLGNTTQFTYSALGKMLTATDALGHATTNAYNAAGNLLTTKDALNNTTSFAYSVFDGQRTSMTDALNNTTRYDYTSGYLTKETDALGHETTFTYDSNSNRASQTVKRTNAQGQLETITTSYEYDKLNRLNKTTFAGGSFTQLEYNSIGQQSATIDELGHRTEFTYDDMGRLTRTDYPDGTHDETTYDAEGRRLTSKDRAGHLTSCTYDELGRLTRTTFADGTFTITTYDAAGQVLTSADARGNVTHYEYDNAGRRTKVRNGLNQETTFAYDANGNQLSMTDALGHTTSYEYDANNRRTKTTSADSTFATVGYDAIGRNVSRTDQAGKTTQFTYDSPGRLTKVTDALNQQTTYAYNELGQQISQTDANNHTTQFEYDQLGRRVKRVLPGGQSETYSYDNGGNLQNKTDFNGKTTTFAYDVMRRLLSKTPDASLNQATISFTYNLTGQRATMSDASGATVYTYDVRNRLASKQTPFGTLSYSYDEAGGLLTTRSSNANGVSVDYSYDSLNRLAAAKDNQLVALNGGVTSYSYDTVGNLQGYTYPNGVTSSYAYNSLNRLMTMTVGTPASSLASYSYTLGPTGNRTAVTELSGRAVNYTYDDLYRLTSESIASDPQGVNGTVSYSYDPVGNRLSRSSSVAAVPSQSSTYDANDRLTSDTYDANGNTTVSSGGSFDYDFENRLITHHSSPLTGFVYDGDGNRVARTGGGLTTNYLVDTNNPTGYAQVVEELQGGSVVKSFTYGHDLVSQRIVGSSLSFYQYDGHGSVRLLTNAAGAVTDTYDYDAFGNLISRTGTTPNDYLYSGEQFEPNLGFYYLRARYLNPSSGRFWTMDSYPGDDVDPLTLHKYLYANGNVANTVDPTGRTTVAELNATLDIGEVLAAEAALTLGTVESALAAGFAGETAVAAATTAGSSGLATALTSLLAFGSTASIGILIGSATHPGGGHGTEPGEEREQEEEIFYRIMSTEERNGLGTRGEITIRNTENFVTQSFAYVISLAAKRPQDYQHLVVYNMQHGTRSALLANGAVSNLNAADFPEVTGLRHISTFPRNEPNIVHVKGEEGGLNFGLRRGTVGVFNSRIISARSYGL